MWAMVLDVLEVHVYPKEASARAFCAFPERPSTLGPATLNKIHLHILGPKICLAKTLAGVVVPIWELLLHGRWTSSRLGTANYSGGVGHSVL